MPRPHAHIHSNQDRRPRPQRSFKKLFGYISGENASQQKISMTTPVFMEKDENEVQMRFVIPKEVAVAVTPQPTGERVAIRKRAGGRFAVIRFPGRLSENLAKENEAKLREWMKTKDLTPAEIKPRETRVRSIVPKLPFCAFLCFS